MSYGIIVLLLVIIIVVIFFILRKETITNKENNEGDKPVLQCFPLQKQDNLPSIKEKKDSPELKAIQEKRRSILQIDNIGESSVYSVYNAEDLLKCFYDLIDELEDPKKLEEAKKRYAVLQNKCNRFQGTKEHIIKEAFSDDLIGKFPRRYQNRVTFFIAAQIYRAYEPYSQLEKRDEWKELYERLIKRLEIHVIFVIPFLSSKTDHYFEEREIDNFVARGNGGDINQAMKNDRAVITMFMKSQHKAFISPLFDWEIGTSSYQPDIEFKGKIENLLKGESFNGLPPGSEIVIYFTGHSKRGKGDFLVYDKEDEPIQIEFEEILSWWIAQDQAQNHHLTIIADCCFSGHWVQKLKEQKKYHKYPICIQAACRSSEEAYESALVSLLTGEEPPLLGQNPQFFQTNSHKSKIKFVDFNRSILEVPENEFFTGMRKVLFRAEDEQYKACLKAIGFWDEDQINPDEIGKKIIALNACHDLPKWLRETTRIDSENRVGFYEKRLFANLQVKTGKEGTGHEETSHSQVFLQVKPKFVPGKKKIKNALFWSLDQNMTCWLFPPRYLHLVDPPNFVASRRMSLAESEDLSQYPSYLDLHDFPSRLSLLDSSRRPSLAESEEEEKE